MLNRLLFLNSIHQTALKKALRLDKIFMISAVEAEEVDEKREGRVKSERFYPSIDVRAYLLT